MTEALDILERIRELNEEYRLTQKNTSRKVLVVDDDSAFVEIWQIVLRLEGCEVDTAYGGETAVKLAKENDYRWIVMDINMPTMDGVTAAKEIRKFNREIPIAFCTGYNVADAVECESILNSMIISKGDNLINNTTIIKLIAGTNA